MMKWSDVNYVLHGQICTVLFDHEHRPNDILKYTGKIVCPDIGIFPYIKSTTSTNQLAPPNYATVIIHTPREEAYTEW